MLWVCRVWIGNWRVLVDLLVCVVRVGAGHWLLWIMRKCLKLYSAKSKIIKTIRIYAQ